MIDQTDLISLPQKKHKILFISDHQLCLSGVGTQARFLIQGLINTGKYSFRCLGGAIKHPNYDTIMVNSDFIIKPIDGFGTPDLIRNLLISERPDAILIFTDPRQFMWLWEMEDEIHQFCPITYWHVWDNDPYPAFNDVWYKSTDLINCISYKTYELVKPNFPDKTNYIPHAFPRNVYFKLPEQQTAQLRLNNFKDRADWFMGLWVNRNATRKMPNDVLNAWKVFLDRLEAKEGHRKAMLIMHTDPMDVEGPNLIATTEMLGLTNNVLFSTQKLDFNDMNSLYNCVDFTVNISKAEGFGLCLTGDTLIDTEKGLKTLKDLMVGDLVRSHDAKFHKVLNKKTREDKVFEIDVYYRKKIKSSDNHPFMVASKNDDGTFSHLWKQADQLKKGDLLCVRKPIISKSAENKSHLIDICDYITKTGNLEITDKKIINKMGFSSKKKGVSIKDIQNIYNISKWQAENVRRELLGIPLRQGRKSVPVMDRININSLGEINNKKTEVNRYIKIDSAFFEFLGWYMAEGSSSGGSGIEIDLHREELPIAKKIEAYIEKTFGIKGKSETYRKNGARYYASSYVLSEFMKNICGNFADGKKLHENLKPYLKEFTSPFLKALFYGDGHKSKNKKHWSYATISPYLASLVLDILTDNGICAFYNYKEKNEHQRESYHIRINGINYEKFCELINDEPYGKKCLYKDKLIIEKEWIYTPIRSITLKEDNYQLFDIQVEDSETFIANGVVVHNCTLSTLEVGKPAIALKTGGLTRQIVDHRDGSEHGVAIEPAARTLVGSQMVPYIYDDHVNYLDVADAYMKIYSMTPEEKQTLSEKNIAYAEYEFSYENMIKQWDESLDKCITNWKTQTQKRWTCEQLVPFGK